MIEQVLEAQTPAIERLRAAIAAEAAAQSAKTRAILDLALEQNWRDADEFEVIGRRPVRIGSEGTPLVDESLPLEVAALTGASVASATELIRDIVNLHGRHEHAWRAVATGRLPLWRAREFTRLADTFGLGFGECLLVDAKVAPALGVLGWRRVLAKFRAAIIEVAPAKVKAHAEQRREGRHVTARTCEDDPSLSWLSALADTGDVLAVEHLLDLVTKALIARGDSNPVDVVRSRALGRLADPEGVLALLDGEPDPFSRDGLSERPSRRRHSPTAQVYVHVTSDVLEDGGAARVEQLGAVLVDELSHVVGHHRISLAPVVHVNGAERAVDGYDIPEWMRESVRCRDRYEVFPYSSREARSCDLDHTVPYRRGRKAQTRSSNLGPAGRRVHRGKTHCGWKLDQPRPGVFWWESPRGQVYRVGPQGTWNLTVGDPTTNCSAVEHLMLWQLDRRFGGPSGGEVVTGEGT